MVKIKVEMKTQSVPLFFINLKKCYVQENDFDCLLLTQNTVHKEDLTKVKKR